MTQILLAEDDRLIGEMVRLNLEQDGYAVTWETDGLAAEAALLAGGADLAVLDVNLPGRTGFEIARRVREAGRRFPILLLTARSDTASKVTGFDVGADDYLTKPFDVPELLARIRALLRRAGHAEPSAESAAVQLGANRIDLASGTVSGPAAGPPLGPAARELLGLLWRRKGTELPFTELLEELVGATPTADGAATATGQAGAASVWRPVPEGLAQLRSVLIELRDRLEADPERPVHFHLTAHAVRFEG